MAGAIKSNKGKAITLPDDQTSEEEQNESSPQRHRGPSHIRTAENLLSASRKRREAKRKAIEAEHKQRVERIRAKIKSFYEERRIKLTQIQDSQWEQLGVLLKTRKSIEKAIFRNVTIIEQATLNMSKELDTMYAARLDEIVEMETTGKLMKNIK